MNARSIQLALVISAVAAMLFVASSGVALAKNGGQDPRGDTTPHEHFTADELKNLDIHKYGFAGKRAYIQVWGTAGGTLPEHEEGEGFGHAIAYVINIVTSSGEHQTWAIDSHEAQHGSVGVGEAWHGHRVVVDEDGCLNEVDQVVSATVKNKHVWFDNMVVRGKSGNLETVNAVEITGAATVLLDVQVADPDNPGDAPCIALVAHVFDTA